MDLPFPAAPASVRPNLARPSREFRMQAWAAIAGLILFLLFYFGLTAWFGWIAWKSFAAVAAEKRGLVGVLVALPALFLFAVMVKGLFFVRRGATRGLVEIREADEPTLYRFVQRVAADVQAPRPHRLFLSARVNAGVFYDLTFWNLVFPSKKNLEIGLGLVNALSLDEFKAVIAHEFGHFAQRTMAVARWVHLAQQLVADLIWRRDVFDRFLDGLSRFDPRIAWIGWILRLVVWSIRSLLDTVFRGVIVLERALSRQMEFQADRVAVCVSGSDSLIHALHRLVAADDAWGRAARFALGEKENGRPVADLFAVQTRILAHLRGVLNDPDLGLTPALPPDDPARYRVFRGGIAEPPRMWATHPPNHEREENAKREYFPSVLDDRTAWELFADPDRLRTEMTRQWLSEAGGEGKEEPTPLVDSLQRIDAQFTRPCLDRRFQGTYLGRDLVRHAQGVAELYGPLEDAGRETVLEGLGELYPPSVADEIRLWRDLEQEKNALEGLRAGSLTTVGRVIRFRDREFGRKDLPALIDQVDRELGAVQRSLQDHDRKVRTLHRQAARLIGGGREDQLVGLLELVHYAEHTEARLEDVDGYLRHALVVITADRKVTRDEVRRLQEAAENVLVVLGEIHAQRELVRWTDTAAGGEVNLGQFLPDTFDLTDPAAEELFQGWLGALASHVGVYGNALRVLRGRSLDALVDAEAAVAEALRRGMSESNSASASIRVPKSYLRLKPGAGRPRSERLGWWERFQIADGLLPGAARFAAAAGILAPALVLSWSSSLATIVVHNGLATPVVVTIDERAHDVGPGQSVRISQAPGHVSVRATSDQTEIERFEAEVGESSAIVYNLAGASSLVEWTAIYGPNTEVPPRYLGVARWFESDADHLFEDPPQTKRKGSAVRVVQALDDISPLRQFSSLESEESRAALALAHARWDPQNHPDLAAWFEMLVDHPEFESLMRSRLSHATTSVGLQRMRMDHGTEAERASLCAALTTQAGQRPDDADLVYLSTRCIPDGPEQNDRFLPAALRFPKHAWLQWAASGARSERGEFAEALAVLEPLMSREDVHRGILGRRVDLSFIRLRRLLAAHPSEADVGPAERWNPAIREWLAVETWTTPPPTASPHDRATFHILRGELDKALAISGLTPSESDSVMLRVALSEGATPEQVSAGLAILERRNEWPFLWPALALAVREGRDPSAILHEIASVPRFPSAFPDAIEKAGRETRPAALDAAVAGLSLELRGAARVAGVLLLGDAAPAAWRLEAKAVLLPYERPFLR